MSQLQWFSRLKLFLVFHQLKGQHQLEGGLIILEIQSSQLLNLGNSVLDGIDMDGQTVSGGRLASVALQICPQGVQQFRAIVFAVLYELEQFRKTKGGQGVAFQAL